MSGKDRPRARGRARGTVSEVSDLETMPHCLISTGLQYNKGRSQKFISTTSEDDYHADDESRKKKFEINTEQRLSSTEPNFLKIGHYLNEFYRNRQPYFETATEDFDNNAHIGTLKQLTEKDNVLTILLTFLFGNPKIVENVAEKLKVLNKESWIWKALQVLDSNPSPQSFREEDCNCWIAQLKDSFTENETNETNIQYFEYNFLHPLVAILRSTGNRYEKLHTRDKQESSNHSEWYTFLKNIISELMADIKAEVFVHMLAKGECTDHIKIPKVWKKGEKVDSGRAFRHHIELKDDTWVIYDLMVRPDLVIITKAPPRALTIKIGGINADSQRIFASGPSSTDTASSLSELSLGAHKDDQKRCDSSSRSGSSETTSSQVHTIIRSEHLLQLVTAARQNAQNKEPNKLFTLSAGLMFFNDAIFVTKLCGGTHICSDALYHHEGMAGFKYVLCDYYLEPWTGHWTSLAFYMLACVLENYVLPVYDAS